MNLGSCFIFIFNVTCFTGYRYLLLCILGHVILWHLDFAFFHKITGRERERGERERIVAAGDQLLPLASQLVSRARDSNRRAETATATATWASGSRSSRLVACFTYSSSLSPVLFDTMTHTFHSYSATLTQVHEFLLCMRKKRPPLTSLFHCIKFERVHFTRMDYK